MFGEYIVSNHTFQTSLDIETLSLDENLDRQIASLLKQLELTISVGEPLTGGLISARLTQFPGSSLYFRGGIICYHPILKVSVCGVPPSLIQANGAVSQATTQSLCQHIQEVCKSDIALAVCGIAGPATEQFPESVTGKTYVYIRFYDHEKFINHHFYGNRNRIRQQATQASLMALKECLLKWKDYKTLIPKREKT